MPYIIVRGNLASYDNKYPWRVLVSGLRTEDIEALRKFPCGGYCDECTIVYLQHPCVILTALEKLGYMIVASSSTSVKQDYNEYMWTMRRACYELDCDSVSQTTNKSFKLTPIIHFCFLKILKTGFSHESEDETLLNFEFNSLTIKFFNMAGRQFISNMSEAHCCKIRRSSALTQSLEEMEFERGIWSAASDGDLLKVQKFLAQGVNPDVRDAAGYTALHYAALKDHVEICDILLQYGADINAVTRAGLASALHRAATSGKMKTVEFLVKKGANVALKDADGRTVLHRATISGRSNICNILSHRHPELLSIVDNKNKLPADYDQS